MAAAMQYAQPGERRVARKLVSTLLLRGFVVDVNDGEEWTVRGSANEAEILNALATTDADLVAFRRHGTQQRLGFFSLVWGNDPDGDELIADHTDNERCEAIYNLTYGETA